jgi:rubrerythrin
MLSSEEFIQQSLELNLFFMRIMKEHAIFMEAAFSPQNHSLAQQADNLKCEFTMLLAETVTLADGVISPEVLTSGELVTKFTCDSERATEFYSGIPIDSDLTRMELSLGQNLTPVVSYLLVDQVSALNQKAIAATTVIAEYKSKLLQDILSCKIFTFNYPLLIDHILREARFYLKMLHQLQNRQIVNILEGIIEQEQFWDRIMAEHAKFIRGLLDPTEDALFDTANRYGKVFDELTKQALTMTKLTTILPQLSSRTSKATASLRDFKTAATEGLLECKIRALAVPLLGDHVLREANHYLRLLNTFNGRLR